MKKKIELVAPAGNMEKLKTVVRYGADAVYLGGKAFSLRAQPANFAIDELAAAIKYCQNLGKKVFVTVNIFAHNCDLGALAEFLQILTELKPNGIIVSDLGVLKMARDTSELPIHISTQANATNWLSVKAYRDLGAKRVILARELTLVEITEIRERVPEIELEVFGHGAMCMAYSGRCHLSSYLTERDGNKGACSNPCRWKYSVMEETREGEYFPVFADDRGTHIFNSKDLCTVKFVDKIIASGVDALKLEGRGKGILYGATTTKTYRHAIDAVYDGSFDPNLDWHRELESYTHRGYTEGFYFNRFNQDAIELEGTTKHPYQYIGKIAMRHSGNTYTITTRNQIKVGMKIEVIRPKRDYASLIVTTLIDANSGDQIDVCHPNNSVKVVFDQDTELECNDLLRAAELGQKPLKNTCSS